MADASGARNDALSEPWSRENSHAAKSDSDFAETVARVQENARNLKPASGERDTQKDQDRKRALDLLGKDLGARYQPAAVTLDKFEFYHAKQRSIVARLTTLAGELPTFIRDGRGLLFYGAVGTGKDHLLAAMLYRAVDCGFLARWINGQEFFGEFRDRIDSGERDEGYLRKLCVPHVLGVSDPVPPVGDIGAWNTANLYRLVDRRYRERKCTWISLNATSVEEADNVLSQPIFDRVRDDGELLPCFWPSYRERRRSGVA